MAVVSFDKGVLKAKVLKLRAIKLSIYCFGDCIGPY